MSRPRVFLITVVLLALLAGAISAAASVVVLNVEGMTCGS